MARYFRRLDGQTNVYWVSAIANLDAPTAAEINAGGAGANLTARIAALSGFQYSNAPIASPDFSTGFVGQITGEDTAAASAFSFYDDTTSTALWTLMAKGAAGFVVFQEYAKTTGSKTRVWPCTSTGQNPDYDMGAKAAWFIVGYAITSRPHLDAVWPSGVTI